MKQEYQQGSERAEDPSPAAVQDALRKPISNQTSEPENMRQEGQGLTCLHWLNFQNKSEDSVHYWMALFFQMDRKHKNKMC